MSGIVGGLGSPDPSTVRRMLTHMRHRGPDQEGFWASEEVVLGQNRLTTMERTPGPLPLRNEDGAVIAVVDGQIYNFRELRARLQAHGHTFRSRGDTEVVVHLWEEHGPELVTRLDGVFAIALYDRRAGRFFLARDPLGIKPLYGGLQGGTLYFASELGGLLAATDQVEEFPQGSCLVRAVQEPSQPLTCLADQAQPYWDVPTAPPDITDPQAAVAGVRERLRRAVEKRLLARVPVGVFLSGGLDSSLIAALARQLTSRQLHSFAVGLAGSDDLRYAARVAEALETVHHEYAYDEADLEEALPTVIAHLESYDPALVRSAIPTYFAARLARQHVKVVLSGEGADELFAGYAYLRRLDRQRLQRELRAVTAALHNTNLQRVDRMTMAHSLEARVPFLDLEVVRWAFRLDPSVKLRGSEPVEKWVLRKAAEGLLPASVVARKKAKFAHGTGTSQVLQAIAARRISAEALRRAQQQAASRQTGMPLVRSREELLYYRLFRERFPQKAVLATVGRTRSVVPGELGEEGLGQGAPA
ncbi:asparagine synthase B [Limnochorda sp.]|uniref:asparagine synthase B n=1 Tax=Limnochorda sp. TaxID=1940279 RepID=UPI001D433B96|nr:asparagine synthetase B [Bacillota bacterium]MBO2519320.1 asparagine synthetase B [Bacillota bacterium]